MIFKAADEEGAVESADFLGKKKVVKRSWGFSYGRTTSNFTEQEEHKIKPYVLRCLPRHTCVLVHSERGYRRRLLPPIEPSGKVVALVQKTLVLNRLPPSCEIAVNKIFFSDRRCVSRSFRGQSGASKKRRLVK